MTLDRIAQILEDMFGIPASRVELSDDLETDWGLDAWERAAFDAEFWAEFNAMPVSERTVEDYVKLVTE